MIEVDVTSTIRSKVDRKLIETAVRTALGRLKASVSVVVIGDQRMRSLNRDALGHDYVTDVLSFDHGDSPEGRVFEIIVCAPHAAREAKRYGVPEKQEVARYVIHGCLHCVGHDDHSESDRAAMWKLQEKHVRKLFGASYRQPN
ncbi:MAG: rRNA maturation RNase YbeY [Planctomycetes bacterium]|nr:rRNA maturation RNase YbeY [Planctomycetota bacterium]MCA8935194.1 rRNA maturation RNase YbeY [Planctomycetota bacterium]